MTEDYRNIRTSDSFVATSTTHTLEFETLNQGDNDDRSVFIDAVLIEDISTPPGQASSPTPADAATDVAIDTDLSWTAGAGADSHDVYFDDN